MREGSEWSFTTRVRLRGPAAMVSVQGHLIPRSIEATWRRSDGLEVLLEVEVTDSDPIPIKATISRPEGLAGISRLPFLAMAQTTAASLAFAPGQSAGTWVAPRAATNELQTVADLYREAIELGAPVNKWVRDGLAEKGVYRSEGTINRLIYQARRTKGPDGDTYLPDTKPGRKHA